MERAEDVSANQINGVKVHFVPETTYKRGGGGGAKGRRALRALTDVDVEWIDVASLGVQSAALSDDGGSGSNDEPIIERP